MRLIQDLMSHENEEGTLRFPDRRKERYSSIADKMMQPREPVLSRHDMAEHDRLDRIILNQSHPMPDRIAALAKVRRMAGYEERGNMLGPKDVQEYVEFMFQEL